MDLYEAKENIQPLAAGRNISLLQASLRQDSPQELLNQRRQLEDAIRNYEGDDPLEPWYAYICWIEQSCPSGGKESGLKEVLTKCLSRFENDKRYYQDRRMIKLYIKFLDNIKDPLEAYQQLFNAGIGTMTADFYIAWAYCYDLCGNYKKAEEIFRHGVSCRAEPFDDLQEAHQHFGYSIAQRFVYGSEEAKSDAYKQLEERRVALTSLRSHKKKGQVGSIRTGSVIKSNNPGKIKLDAEKSSSKVNTIVNVFKDENNDPNIIGPPRLVPGDTQEISASNDGASAVRSIIDASRNQENMKEPGPWNKAHEQKKSAGLFSTKNNNNGPGFEIHIDEEEKKSKKNLFISKPLNPPIKGFESRFDKPFRRPVNFVSKNKRLAEWILPVTTEIAPDPKTYPQYNKCKLYPRPNKEFQIEELLAYNWFKRRDIANEFTKARDPYWTSYDVHSNVRMYPNFAKKSAKQTLTEMDQFYSPSEVEGLIVGYKRIYNIDEKLELSLEELYANKFYERFNKTIMATADMEETVCITSENVQRRKSFFPSRKSMAPRIFERISNISNVSESEQESEASQDTVPQLETAKSDCNQNEEGNQHTDSLTAKENKPIEINKKEEEISQLANNVKNNDDQKKIQIAGLPFEIYTEETEVSFQFKPPAIPQLPAPTGKPLKVKFDVNDENDPQLLNPCKPTSAAGFFEDEETCSTQTFNIFLKSQSVSTPKAQKVAPLRQFGTVIAECASESPESNIDNEILETAVEEITPQNSESSPIISPQRKQLSTILETSEHGTTHGTTGSHASTKSTISSSENDDLPTKTPSLKPLETLEEATNESLATLHSRTEEISNHLQNLHVSQSSKINAPQTPGLARLIEQKPKEESNVFSGSKEVGNFTRLEEREDTANAFGAIRPVRFPEEKTETITKFMLTSKHDFKLNEDKTETISKIYFPPSNTKFEDEKTTGTIPKIHIQAPKLTANTNETLSDDSFDFFKKTPPKVGKLSDRLLSQADNSPLSTKPAKRFCDIDTPESIPKASSLRNCDKIPEKKLLPTIVIFEDEDMPSSSTDLKASKDHSSKYGKSFKNPSLQVSFMEDFSLMAEPSQAAEIGLVEKTSKSSKVVSGKHCESFLPDLSFVPETQPDVNQDSQANRNNLVKDVSIIPDSQPNVEKSSHFKNQSAKQLISESNQKCDNSFIPDSQASASNARKWKQSPGSVDNVENSHLLKSFMQDFASIKQPPSIRTQKSVSNNGNVSLKFLNDSINQMKENNSGFNGFDFDNISENKKKTQEAKNDKFFELNAETAMFSSNISMIKNSTWLPNHDPVKSKLNSFQEESLHIKQEANSFIDISGNSSSNVHSVRLSIELSSEEKAALTSQKANQKDKSKSSDEIIKSNSRKIATTPNSRPYLSSLRSNEHENSIYYARTPRTPILRESSWDEDLDAQSDNVYSHNEVDLNYTVQLIENLRIDPNVNPFSEDLIRFFLDNKQFTTKLKNLESCELTGRMPRLQPHHIIKVKTNTFEVQKLIGQGAYGAVWRGKDCKTGKKYAFKQERPPSYWEYYICLEVRKRLRIEDLYPAYMYVDYAIIANNASVLISQLSEHGSIITVANNIKKRTNKNIDEYVVMHLACELLAIFDHLHAIGIIHADVKADNVLLMNKLSYKGNGYSLQLIDFGVAIDMKLFKHNQTFNYVHNDEAFKCIEMRENRGWSYQLDLYGLAGIIHVMLFGKYMEVEKRSGYWMHKTHVPRYFNKILWETIFRSLLNIPDSFAMPNLQQLRTTIKEDMLPKEKYVIQAINDFNTALT